MSQGHTITRPYLQDQADPQSGTHTHAPCLQDCIEQITHTHNTPCQQDRIEQIASQGHTHNTPCLQDRIKQIARQGHTQHTLPTRPH